jgi:hypothetical protein
MSAASGIGKAAGSTLFTVFISMAVLIGTFSIITSEANVRTALTDVFETAITEKYSTEQLEQIRLSLQDQCGPLSETVRQDFGSLSLDVDCSRVRLGSASELPAIFRDAYVDQVYFRDYSCFFIDCFRQAQGVDKATVLLSQHGNSFFITAMWASIALAVLGLVLIVASVRHAFSVLKIIGIGMVVAGIPGFFIKSLVPDLGGTGSGVALLITAAIDFMSTTYIGIFVIGIVLAIAGFALSAKFPPVRRKYSSGERVQRSFTPRYGTEAQYSRKGGHGVHYSRGGQPYIKDRLGRVRFIRKSKQKK